MPSDFEEFARIIARNFPEQPLHIEDYDFQQMQETGKPETFTVAWVPGLGKIDIVFTPDF